MLPTDLRSQKFQDTLSKFAIFFIFASLLYQISLCFINTHLFAVSKSSVVLVEILLVGSGFALFIKKMHVGFMLFIIFILVNALLLTLFKGYLEPKNIRDFLIPILTLWLGLNYNNRIEINKLVKYCAIIIIGLGLFEFAFSSAYISLFNIAKYHLSIGLISEHAMDYRSDAFALNGERLGGREFLSFLGNHRVSSVFLETVNMGNFGVLIACWGLSKENSDRRNMLLFIALGITTVVLADSRFGFTMIMGLALIRFAIPINVIKKLASVFPLFIITVTLIAYQVYGTNYTNLTDDFKGRLGITGYNITHFTFPEYFGISSMRRSFVDSGYCYSVFNNGLIFCLAAWILFVSLKPKDNDGLRYQSLIAIMISALLAVSGSSVFALKFNALMWFLMGVMLQRKSDAY